MSAFSDRVRSQSKGTFKVADLEGGKELTMTISRLDEEMEMFGKTVDILNFQETGKQLQLNQTTSEWLLANLGDDPETYPGKKVVLHLAEYEFEGAKKLGIRLKLLGTKPAAKEGTIIPPASGDGASKTPSASRADDFDDSIPF